MKHHGAKKRPVNDAGEVIDAELDESFRHKKFMSDTQVKALSNIIDKYHNTLKSLAELYGKKKGNPKNLCSIDFIFSQNKVEIEYLYFKSKGETYTQKETIKDDSLDKILDELKLNNLHSAQVCGIYNNPNFDKNLFDDLEESTSLTEAVTFVDNAGKVKTMTAENYVKSMHKYDTKTQIPSVKIKKNKEYKLISENKLVEAHRDDPEVVELIEDIKTKAKRLEELGINTKHILDLDGDVNALDESLYYNNPSIGCGFYFLKRKFSISKYKIGECFGRYKEWERIQPRRIGAAELNDIKELLEDSLESRNNKPSSGLNAPDINEIISKLKQFYLIAEETNSGEGGFCIGTQDGVVFARYDTENWYIEVSKDLFNNVLKEDGHLSGDMTIEDVAKKHNVSVEELEKQVKMGIEVEHEHTSDDEEAKRIALDHLYELPDYYTRLDKMEEEGEEALDEAPVYAIHDGKMSEVKNLNGTSMSKEDHKKAAENGTPVKINGKIEAFTPKRNASGDPAGEVTIGDKGKTAKTIYSKYKLPVNESVLDPVQKERCREIFDLEDKMLPEVKKQILDRFFEWKDGLEEKFTVDAVYLIGSSSGFQYTPTSDVDITVVSHDYTDEIWDKVKDTIPNGNNLEGTEHPVNYFIRVDMDERKAENIYDIQKDEWVKKTDKAVIDIHMPYIVEMARFFMNAFDLTLKEYERDKMDYLQLKELDPERVEISEEERADALTAKLTELKADLDSIRMGNHVLRGFLHEAYEEDDGIFEIHIEIKGGDDPRLSPNNLVYKLLERYGYREKIDSTIKDAEEFIEKNELEKDLNESLAAWLEDDSEILFEDFYKRYSKKADVRKTVKKNDLWNPASTPMTNGLLTQGIYSLLSKKRLDKKATEVSDDPEVKSTKSKLESLIKNRADKKEVKVAYKNFEMACLKAQYRKKEKVKKE